MFNYASVFLIKTMNYQPTEQILQAHDFVLKERKRHIANVYALEAERRRIAKENRLKKKR